LLSDSRSSFAIEGERPSPQRAQRWGQAIDEAGSRPLSIEELERLQRVVIGDARFVRPGLRTEGGFVGEHDRQSQRPLPQHISASPVDLQDLLAGIIAFGERALAGQFDPVISAATLAFGFVYIHPFEDGNGRLHRWLIHHVLAEAEYNPPGLVFPVSVPIVRDLDRYREVLESYSRPLLPLIQWKETLDHNVEVLNETKDYYRYFDATEHANFLFSCVQETIDRDLPGQVAYLEAFDSFEAGVQQIVDMPRKTIESLNQFLRQGNGRIPKGRRSKEFKQLEDVEVEHLEQLYRDCFAKVPAEAFE
jgi:Fic family protein